LTCDIPVFVSDITTEMNVSLNIARWGEIAVLIELHIAA